MTFGTLGYGPRARSVLHCHGVWPGAVQGGPDPPFTAMVFAVQKATSKLEVGRQSQGLELQFLVGSESEVWPSGPRAR